MNCKGCFNLIDNKCKLGKHSGLKPLLNEKGEVESLSHSCIFKNTQYPNVDFKQSHNLAKTQIAIAAYYFLTKENVSELEDLIEKEKGFEDNIIGQFNVITSDTFSVEELKRICEKLRVANGKRLWNFSSIKEEIKDTFIQNNCKLPYYTVLENEADLAEIQTFKWKAYSGEVPQKLGKITSIRLTREENADFQI